MPAEIAASLLAVLVASDTPETQHDLKKLLDGSVATGHASAVVVVAVADALGSQGDKEAVTALRRLSQPKYFADVFACRRAVVQALAMIRLPEAIDVLVALLPKMDGEVRGDIVRHLTAVTRQQHGFDAGAWQAWWKQNRDQFQFPPQDAKAPAAPVVMAGLPSYYGLSIQARRLVFVVDISGSMEGMRIATLKRRVGAGHRRPARRHHLQHRGFQFAGRGLAAEPACRNARHETEGGAVRHQSSSRRGDGLL